MTTRKQLEMWWRYLNASWGMAFPYSQQNITDMGADAVISGDFLGLHLELAAVNHPTDGICPIK